MRMRTSSDVSEGVAFVGLDVCTDVLQWLLDVWSRNRINVWNSDRPHASAARATPLPKRKRLESFVVDVNLIVLDQGVKDSLFKTPTMHRFLEQRSNANHVLQLRAEPEITRFIDIEACLDLRSCSFTFDDWEFPF
jgi:hypothetical protein